MSQKILCLPGDGIGPEVVAEAVKLINVLKDQHGLSIGVGAC